MQIQHSSRDDSWQTPIWVLDLVKEVLGDIDIDPASSPEANLKVQANTYFTKEDDSLKFDWFDSPKTVYINPPGGKRGNKSMTALFWERLLEHRSTVGINHAIFMCFSAEAIQTTQNKSFQPIGNFPLCVPSKRIAFDDPTKGGRTAPSHSNAIVYVPGLIDKTDVFAEVFSKIGSVLVPYKTPRNITFATSVSDSDNSDTNSLKTAIDNAIRQQVRPGGIFPRR